MEDTVFLLYFKKSSFSELKKKKLSICFLQMLSFVVLILRVCYFAAALFFFVRLRS